MGDHRQEGAHASAWTYIKVALVLTGVTTLEVGAIYIRQLTPIIVPLLLALSAAKFALVVLFYMHLRYDSRVPHRAARGAQRPAPRSERLLPLQRPHGAAPRADARRRATAPRRHAGLDARPADRAARPVATRPHRRPRADAARPRARPLRRGADHVAPAGPVQRSPRDPRLAHRRAPRPARDRRP